MPLIKLFSREYSVQYTEASIRSLSREVKAHLPALLRSQAYLPEDKNEACYADEREWKNLLKSLEKKYRAEHSLKKFFKTFHHFGKAYLARAKKINRINLNKLSNEVLATHYRAYQKILTVYSAYLWMGYLLASGDHLKKSKAILEKKEIRDERVVNALFRPKKLSSILSLQEKLSNLKAKKLKLSSKEINQISKNYSWMPCLDIQNDPWTTREIKIFFAHLKPSLKPLSFVRATQVANLKKAELKQFELLSELTYVKDMRDEYRRRAIYYILPLFNAISLKLAVSRHQLAYFTSQEIIKALNAHRKLEKKTALKRQAGFLIYTEKSNIKVLTSTSKIAKFKKSRLSKNVGEKLEVKGLVASLGQARGKVKIVLGIKDLKNVKKGDVMIAITTHPDFVPAMHRAAAIVTDEGGLTSHAAIVCRELGTPCIVGTRIATKIFKDGDIVEVNPKDGIIKKINI
ncbi:MAG: PEP-utilizing enzyme [Patescibacteria group bacterium]